MAILRLQQFTTNLQQLYSIFLYYSFCTGKYGTVKYGTVQYGTVKYDTDKYDTGKYGTVCICDKYSSPPMWWMGTNED